MLFAVGLTLVLIGFTYAIQPYGSASMGWGNPWVIGELAGGLALLAVFVAVERRVPDPMFRLELFRIRMFAAGNIAGFLSSLARGGLQLHPHRLAAGDLAAAPRLRLRGRARCGRPSTCCR